MIFSILKAMPRLDKDSASFKMDFFNPNLKNVMIEIFY